MSSRHRQLIALVILLASSTGCRQMGLIFHTKPAATSSRAPVVTPRAILASYRGTQEPPERAKQTDPAGNNDHKKTPSEEQVIPEPETQEATEAQAPNEGQVPKEDQLAPEPKSDTEDEAGDEVVATATAYTAPSPMFRNLALFAMTTTAMISEELTGAGREVSESVMFSADGVVGRVGLTAPPTTVENIVLGRPGLVDGPATGLAFANPTANIFTPRINRLSGVNGRCAELARAGFFGGGRGRCESSLHR